MNRMKQRENDTQGAAKPILRRPKASPCEDFWHTLAVGVPIAGLLFLILPGLFAHFF
jgi:hypothetical protein